MTLVFIGIFILRLFVYVLLALSIHHVGLRDGRQVVRLDAKSYYLPSCLSGPLLEQFKKKMAGFS